MTKDEINAHLVDKFGIDIEGRPRFRIVWSNDETETRVGKFVEFYNDIFVREYYGREECKKYNYLDSRWVLEILTYGCNPELTENFSYEPLYVFQDKHYNFLPLNYDAVLAVIYSVLNRPEKVVMTESQMQYAEQAEHRSSVARNLQILKDKGNPEEIMKARLGETIYNAYERKDS